jgi:hypothetical protein
VVTVLLIAGLLAGACAPSGEIAQAGDTGPLTMLPPCDPPPAPINGSDVAGLVVPDGSVITEVTPQTPITSVQGYVEMTPVQIRLHYAERDDIELLALEDEVFEAEVLLRSGAQRMYLKALARCDEGSSLLAIVAPDGDAEGLPIPDGTPDPLLTDT